MDISKLINESLRGQAPRIRERQAGGLDPSPPQEFLHHGIWPLLKETREALERTGIVAVATQPAPHDNTHMHALLILHPGKKSEDACFARFFMLDGKLYTKICHPKRSDAEPVLLEPVGSIIHVHGLLEEFVYHCLAPLGTRIRAAARDPKPLRHAGCCNGGLQLKTA